MSKSDSTYAGLVSLVIYKVPKKNHDAILQIRELLEVWRKYFRWLITTSVFA
jgi:hypothetical protein